MTSFINPTNVNACLDRVFNVYYVNVLKRSCFLNICNVLKSYILNRYES